MDTKPITEEQRAYILAHLNDRPRTDVARAAGVAVSTVYRLVRRHGGNMDYGRSRRNVEWERIVRENYPTMSGHEIERKFGMTRNRANAIARRIGVRHTAATLERMKREENARLRAATHDYKAAKRKWLMRRRLDEMRVWNGEEQRTRHKFAKLPMRAYKARYHLIHNYGYVQDANDPYTLLWTDKTDRRDRTLRKNGHEDYYTKKYHLRFKEAE